MPALRGELPEEQVDRAARALEADVEPLGPKVIRDPRAFFAGMEAVWLTAEAWDGDLDPELYPPEEATATDPLVEALAAWAVAYKDREGTRAYWRWYVSGAFPAAFAAA